MASFGRAPPCGWRVCLRNVRLGVAPHMTDGCCMEPGARWVSPLPWGYELVGVDRPQFQTLAGKHARASCSAVGGDSSNAAYQTSVHPILHRRLLEGSIRTGTCNSISMAHIYAWYPNKEHVQPIH